MSELSLIGELGGMLGLLLGWSILGQFKLLSIT